MTILKLAALGVAAAALAGLWAVLAGEQDAEQKMDSHKMQADGTPKHTNRLINATSPYLLQHAHNPVDWHEWGPEAFEKAKKENKPIFLSIGYSACHWCHVMAHESFEDEEIAGVMNELFVNIKLDREERPDIDDIYMRATVMFTRGHGGWPMSVWLTPELEPFFGGTYFPPRQRGGQPGFKELCEQIGRAWAGEQKDRVIADAKRMTELLAQQMVTAVSSAGTIEPAFLDEFAGQLRDAFDPVEGGMLSGSTNKFPPSMAMDLLMRTAHRNSKNQAAAAAFMAPVKTTLDHMAAGGIYDQLGGGIARYSTDSQWLVPHFEKMLYDQALVSRSYIDAHLLTGEQKYADVAADIFNWVLADLQSPEGGFWCTWDADSEGEEGKYYVWSREEIMDVVGDDDGELFCAYYDVSAAGNWEGRNILNVPKPLEAVAAEHKIEPATMRERLGAVREKLLAVRSKRVPPHRDEKILCEWNGMMISSLARGGAVLGEKRFIDAASRAADFILDKQSVNGRLVRSYREGRRLETAFLTDYAYMIEALLELYEATFDKRRLEQAVKLNEILTRHYWDNENGGYYFGAADGEKLITRIKEVSDGATPSGNSVQLMNLLRLSIMLGDQKLREMAEKSMSAFAGDVKRGPHAAERFLAGVDFALAGSIELAVVGDPADARTQEFLKLINSTYLPNRVLMLSNPAKPDANVDSPLLENRPLVDGKPAVYLCRNYVCGLPATTIEMLKQQLAAPPGTDDSP